MGTEINVVDEPMGAGKTSAAINFINNTNNEETRFLVITPYLREVLRYRKCCPEKHFMEPMWENGAKLNNVKTLVQNGENIVTTHALFQRFDKELIDLLSIMHYTLIMDEVANVVDLYDLTRDDQKNLMEKYIYIDNETKLVRWREDQSGYTGKFTDIKNMCDLGSLTLYSENCDSNVVVWLFPVQVFKCFKSVYLLTYMFSAQLQRYYYDFFNLKYNYLYITGSSTDDYMFTNEKPERKADYRKLINILDNEKLNMIGRDPFTLSKSWYEKASNTIYIKGLKDNVYNFFYHYANGKSADNIWTVFKDYRNLLSGKGYSKGFLELNARATNEYRERTNVAYLVNVYMNPVIHHFFTMHGVDVDQDGYALSEMLQFIWRSAIRDGKPINVYIPSKRMRTLLMEWIEKTSD